MNIFLQMWSRPRVARLKTTSHDQWCIQFPLLPLLCFPVAMDSSVGYFLIRFRKFLALIALPVPLLRQVWRRGGSKSGRARKPSDFFGPLWIDVSSCVYCYFH